MRRPSDSTTTATVHVGAIDREAGDGAERRQCGRRRVPVVVAGADRDDRDPRPQLLQLVAQPVVGGSVMRDLEDLDRRELETTGDVRLRVGGEQRVGLSERRDEHDGVVVRVVARRARPVRPHDAEPQRTDPERLPRARDDHPDAALPRSCAGRTLVRALAGNRRIEHRTDTQLLQDLRGAADVIALRVRHDEQRQASLHRVAAAGTPSSLQVAPRRPGPRRLGPGSALRRPGRRPGT